ncbi:MAG: hypothetical protein ILO36_00325, partial [Abditibacteriota bacterium]|nr:hypothetical protein [Abditibacteriota bacterium]
MLCGASYLKEGKENTEKEAGFLKELGFTDIEKENYYGVRQTERSDKAGLYIARRKIFDGSKETELLLCVVRGTVAGEWFSNFDVGEGDEHRGFAAAAENAFGYIQSYMVRHAVPRTAKVLITGHSRGAAVASMLVPMLKESGFGEDSVYAYVYACPNYTKNLVPGEKGLFGFMYEGDLVPAIPIWGFGMRGEVIDSVSFSPEEKKQLKDSFSRIAGGIKTVAFTAEERDGVVAAITKLAPDQEAFYTTVYSKSRLIKADPMTTYDFCVKMGKIMVQREVKRVLRVPDDFNGIMWAFVTDGAASPKIIQSHSIEMYYALTQVYNARFAKAAN